MSKYFTINELTYSDTAKKLNITNTPNAEQKAHLEELMVFLDRLRESWGSGIRITSGYRCKELNKAVGGVPTSAHIQGYAADIVPSNGKMREFKEFVVKWAKDKVYDQIIVEKSGKSEWVHIGLKNIKTEQRKQCFSLSVK